VKAASIPIDPGVVRERLAPVFAGHPEVAAAYLFGSVARGSAGPESDLDIGVVYRGRRVRERRPRVAAELASEIGSALGFDLVDLVDLEAQGPIFCHRVLCEGRRLYEGDHWRRVDFESNVIVRALDFRPTYDLATRGKPAALRRWLAQRPV
jgi:hypothetical protein